MTIEARRSTRSEYAHSRDTYTSRVARISRRDVQRLLQNYRGRYAAVQQSWSPKPGFLYTTTRAISARVNQNFDSWPSEELRKAYKTFLGKPIFVNHANFDPSQARGKIVAARYVDAGHDKHIEVIQEVDAQRFPKLAHEIRTGGLDSVSMGVEAGYTKCSACHNIATDLHDMCDHVRFHKGEHIMHGGKRVQVYEDCYKLGFFELSYVFDPADETAVVSRVISAASDDQPDDESEPDWGLPKDLMMLARHADDDGGDYTPFRGREHDRSLPVRAYRNLHNGKWSLRAMDGEHKGRIIGHADEVHLSPAQFVVSQAGNQRVRDEGSKNVHAFVQGMLSGPPEGLTSDDLQGVTYNPYKYRSFVRREDEGPVDLADHVHLGRDGKARALNPRGRAEDTSGREARLLKRAFGEVEAPEDVDTLRNESDDDTDDFQHYVQSPDELRSPDFDQAERLDRDQEQMGLDGDRNVEDVPDVAMTPQGIGPQPQEATAMARNSRSRSARRFHAEDDGDFGGDTDDNNDFGHDDGDFGGDDDADDDRFDDEGDDGDDDGDDFDGDSDDSDDGGDDSDDGGEGGGDLPPWLAGGGHEARRVRPAARGSLSSRGRVVSAGRRRHYADDNGLTDGGPYGENDQGVKEETYISQTPSAESVEAPSNDGSQISNSDSNLVARRKRLQKMQAQLAREVAQFNRQVSARRRVADADSSAMSDPKCDVRGAETAEQVHPEVQDPAARDLHGDFTEPALIGVETQPKNASTQVFRAFDRWLQSATGRTAAQHGNARFIRRSAARYCQANGIPVEALFPALGTVLRQARRRFADDESLDVAAPNERIDVESPVKDTNDAESQASQFDLHDFGQNAGDGVADPDLSTDTQIWAPGEGDNTRGPQSEKAARKADAVAAVRYAEAYISAGLASSPEEKWKLVALAQTMRHATIVDRTRLLESVIQANATAARRSASRQRRASLPPGFTQGRVAATRRVAEHDPSNDVGLFI